jgi:hypothetical protein
MMMGLALELGKLVTASWIYRFWNKANRILKTYFITAICVLSFITSLGIFGYLTRSFIEGTQGVDTNADQISLLDTQIEQEKNALVTYKNTLTQLDQAVVALSQNRETLNRSISVRNAQRREKADIIENIEKINGNIQELQKQKIALSQTQRTLETEIGPIKYVADMVYGGQDQSSVEKAVRLLIFLLIFVFDPLAILLVIAANMQIKEMKEEESRNTFVKMTSPKNKIDPENVAELKMDWNPGAWFKMVKKPKSNKINDLQDT